MSDLLLKINLIENDHNTFKKPKSEKCYYFVGSPVVATTLGREERGRADLGGGLERGNAERGRRVPAWAFFWCVRTGYGNGRGAVSDRGRRRAR